MAPQSCLRVIEAATAASARGNGSEPDPLQGDLSTNQMALKAI